MKKKQIYSLLALMLLFSSISFAQNPVRNETDTRTSWIAAENYDGLKISCNTYLLNGQSFLAITFENLTATELSFNWSLKDGSWKIANGDNLKIESRGSVTIKNEKSPIPFSEGGSQALMTFEITKK